MLETGIQIQEHTVLLQMFNKEQQTPGPEITAITDRQSDNNSNGNNVHNRTYNNSNNVNNRKCNNVSNNSNNNVHNRQ